jgi:hypothetical protein
LSRAADPFFPMHIFLTALAVVFVIAGFAGFAYGGLPTIIFWTLAAFCIIGAWRGRPQRIRAREDRLARRPRD